MNKLFYNLLVDERCVLQVESLLNRLRVGLNDWDKTKAFDYCGGRYVNYTIMCTSETYETITSHLYES